MRTIHLVNQEDFITDEQVFTLGESNNFSTQKPLVLNFEGLADLEEVLDFYNGGKSKAGFSPNVNGVHFSEGAQAIISMKNGGTGNLSREDLPATALFFMTGEGLTINVDSGFTSAFSFSYTSSSPGFISIYSGPDGTGELLASKRYQAVEIDENISDSGVYFDQWKEFRMYFADTAMSVVITGAANQCAFDDVTLGKEAFGNGKGSAFVSALSTPVQMTEKGNLFIMGASRFGIEIGKEKSESSGSTAESDETIYYNLDFLPKVGYFFINNLAGGAFIDLEVYNNKPSGDPGYGFKKGTTFVIGPFARYYVPVWNGFLPFAEAQVGFGLDNNSSKSYSSDDWNVTKESVFTYRIGAGGTYFINKVVGADFFAGFQHDSNKDHDSDSKTLNNMFILQLGIVVVLDL